MTSNRITSKIANTIPLPNGPFWGITRAYWIAQTTVQITKKLPIARPPEVCAFRASVLTIDGDFAVYRKHGRRVIPLIAPTR